MQNKIHIGSSQVILNYNRAYPRNRESLLGSEPFKRFLRHVIETSKQNNAKLFDYVTMNGKFTIEEATDNFTTFLRILAIFRIDEVDSEYLNDRVSLLAFVNMVYDSWRSLQRFGYMYSEKTNDFGINTLVKRDSDLNDLILRTYRLFEEKIQERPNLVYRQVQAGTNACFSVHHVKDSFAKEYEKLSDIPVIDTVMLRTPMILHPKSSKRTGMFEETDHNPIDSFHYDPEDWFCFPMKVGKLLCFVYFNSKYMASAISLANLFELATFEESKEKPDLIVLYGNEDNKNQTVFYHDTKNNIWLGSISDHPRVEYFGYMKKMALTLHNLAMMHQGLLPIHGAFVKITLNDGRTKGIMLMGDSGAGKSESIEAMKVVGKDVIKDVEVIFDDMGTIHIEDGVPYGQGTEIGAFIRLDDLDPGTPYRDIDRSIFMAPENPNARMIVPASPYQDVITNHKIDLFAYANNYTDEYGLKELSVDEVKETCKMGKRMALGTTQEVGISTTYFANPFGPMQQQDVCEPLIDDVFQSLKDNGVFVGEIYTHLGFDKLNRQGLHEAATELLEFIRKD